MICFHVGSCDLAAEAARKVTPRELAAVASKMSGNWEVLAMFLAPDLFTPNECSVIKKENGKEVLRARAMLVMWSENFGEKASRQLLIQAMCESDCKAEAVKVFNQDIVDFVTQQLDA